ncbi:MAG: NapC/NirT family cytochrome c [Planctomycetota bacterium]|jgi:nitrate/TMAO reductase-like tetraheme cytochrome c subunit
MKIAVVIIIVAAGSGGAVVVTGTTGFCNSCHIMNTYHASWQESEHAEVNCLDCHLQPGFSGYVAGKINGLAQAVDCVVGRVGTKPSATVSDASCLRSDCHSTAELVDDSLDHGGVKFTHTPHIEAVVGGMEVSCGTCHSHFEGDAHFSVNHDACFSCHFLGGKTADSRLVQTTCQSCHEVPREVIRRGFVTIDHREFVSYEASCEESCHKREVVQRSQVEDTVCLNCHDYRMEADANSVELHASHTEGEKIECFSCHGKIEHGQTRVASVSAMMDCRSCHSDTHQVQRTLYSTQHPSGPHNQDRVLSPMFLTHVECTSCHIERTAKTTGTLDSFGTVARAVPAACDSCHEDGTGQKYVPFWQSRIKTLYERVGQKVQVSEALAEAQTDAARAQAYRGRVREARSILDSIAADGSWGVHNFKYTETLLLEAEKIISGEG